jgi:hypothetical protein|tara:strand:+ start:91 stop:459 length:369 start_codon:yes stop_codon:yes gene_type:complete
MNKFNKYDFLSDLEDSIRTEQPEDIWEMVHQEIDRECIYYSDCFDIIKALNFTDWEDNELGQINNITQLAFTALYDFVVDNLNTEPLTENSQSEDDVFVLTDKKAFALFAHEINTKLKNIIK